MSVRLSVCLSVLTLAQLLVVMTETTEFIDSVRFIAKNFYFLLAKFYAHWWRKKIFFIIIIIIIFKRTD